MRATSALIFLVSLSSAGLASAQDTTAKVGASVGRSTVDSDTGDSRGLRLELGVGSHASVRFDVGQTDFNSQRRDRHAGASLAFDLTEPLRLGSSVALTPHLVAGLGVTGSDQYILDAIDLPVRVGYDWRPHAEAGGGVRLSFGRAAIDLGAITGIRRRSIQLQVVEDNERLSSFFGSGASREHYTRYQVSALVSF